MEDFTTFICYELKITMKKLEKYLAQKLEDFGVNFSQSLILFCLLDNDGCSLSEIGSRAQIENSSLTTMVDKLEKEGLVERRADTHNRRIVRLFLTDRGRDLGKRVHAAGVEFNRQLRQNLGGNEECLIKALNSISRSLEK